MNDIISNTMVYNNATRKLTSNLRFKYLMMISKIILFICGYRLFKSLLPAGSTILTALHTYQGFD
jgi:hypothetical protein